MNLEIELIYEAESDRWWANIDAIPGLSKYGKTKLDAEKNIKLLALQVIADFVEHGEMDAPEFIRFVTLPEGIAA